MDHILHKILHEAVADNGPIRIYVNKIENSVTLKIKTGYYLKLLMPETMKSLGRTKNKITKDENGENVPYLEIPEVVLFYCNFFNNDYQQNSRVLYTFIWNKLFGQFYILHIKIIFLKPLIQSFHILKYGLLIKILNCLDRTQNKHYFTYQLMCNI